MTSLFLDALAAARRQLHKRHGSFLARISRAGRLTFTLPSAAGPYEFRYFLNDGFTRVSASSRIVVP
jgi:hypothetical protein